uniref:DUF4094 domain-containing protein n=1 Tax=Rhabditophanes sp. KR3021 TaxID=114890 RepID=A0AC35TX70_9BILA
MYRRLYYWSLLLLGVTLFGITRIWSIKPRKNIEELLYENLGNAKEKKCKTSKESAMNSKLGITPSMIQPGSPQPVEIDPYA